MSHRVERFSSTLKHCLGDILINEVHNPELKFISITRVDVSPDLKQARVFFSSPPVMVTNPSVQLTKARGFMKRMLAKKMVLKYVPELIFEEDVSGGSENIKVDAGGQRG